MDQVIEEAFQALLRDLSTAGLSARLKEDSSGLKDGMLRADLSVGGRRIGHLAVDPAQEPSVRTWWLAHQVQDLILEEVRDAEGHNVPWPRCTEGHPHPMRPAPEPDEAIWVCPSRDGVTVPMGEHPGL